MKLAMDDDLYKTEKFIENVDNFLIFNEKYAIFTRLYLLYFQEAIDLADVTFDRLSSIVYFNNINL